MPKKWEMRFEITRISWAVLEEFVQGYRGYLAVASKSTTKKFMASDMILTYMTCKINFNKYSRLLAIQN